MYDYQLWNLLLPYLFIAEGIGLLNNNSVSSISSSSSMLGPPIKECANCGKRITERFLLKALDLFWHEDCLKCGCCDCRLGEVGSTLYTKANLILCKRDYLRYIHVYINIVALFFSFRK